MRKILKTNSVLFILGLVVMGASCFSIKRGSRMIIVAKSVEEGNIEYFKVEDHIGIQKMVHENLSGFFLTIFNNNRYKSSSL